VNSSNQNPDPQSPVPWTVESGQVEPRWYAIHTRSQHEKCVASRLQDQGITTFLPLVAEMHRWHDRRKVVQLPLFSCYAFVHMSLCAESWYKVLRVNGVLRFVGSAGKGLPVPDGQIESVRKLLSAAVPYTVYPFLKLGQRVRIRGGSLEGIEGILTARDGNRSLVISVEPIQRSLSIRIDDYHVEPI
jgi:transcription termination/antitermination protein NusG